MYAKPLFGDENIWKEVAHTFYAQPLLSVLLGFFEEFLQEFDVFIGHFYYGVGVGAVEIDEP